MSGRRKLKNDELSRMDVDTFKKVAKMPIVILLDNVRSAHNVGSIFRTADAFLIKELVLCGITAQPPHKEIMKTALGATESVKWSYESSVQEVIEKYKEEGYSILSLEQTSDSTMLNEFQPDKDKKYVLVFGNEVAGVSDSVIVQSDFCIEIPQFGTKHSFNIAISVGIVLWDFSNKIKLNA